MRSVRSEVLSVLAVLSVPLAIAVFFPYEAIGFRAVRPDANSRESFRAAFVSLPAADERIALQAAKTSWQRGDAGVRRLRANLIFADLPAAAKTSVLGEGERPRTVELPVAECSRVPFLPSCGAAAPRRIAPDGSEANDAAFSRDDLLKIN